MSMFNNRPTPRIKSALAVAVFMTLTTLATKAPAFEHGKAISEPYKLAGKRMVFTTWYFVRPGQLDWLDATGKSVFTSKAPFGPTDCRFVGIDTPRGVRLVAEPARRLGPIIQSEKPWEAVGISIGTVLFEDGKYRIWGGCEDAEGNGFDCYYESADMKAFIRPKLGLVEYKGSRDNNLLRDQIGSVFKDPAGGPAERYKSVWQGDLDLKVFEEYKTRRPWSVAATQIDPGRVHSILAAVSPDGIRWTRLPDPVSVEVSDTHIVAYYDELLGKYVMYTRTYMVGPRAESVGQPMTRRNEFMYRRAIGRSETSNFREFPLAELIIETASDMPPTDTYYTNCRTTIPGGPDHHVMFPAIYRLDRDTTDIEMQGSYDGKSWHRLPGSPVLKTADFGQWDGGCIFAVPNLVELPDGSWALPYIGYDLPHKYPRGAYKFGTGLAVWPKGRLAAIAADEVGQFATAAVLAPGSKLKINAVTERGGSILVEAADLAGKPIPGRSFDDAVPVIGDQFWAPVAWKSAADLGVKPGEPVELRFRMNMARIYGLEFE